MRNLFWLWIMLASGSLQSQHPPDYHRYHEQITEAEVLISQERFPEALDRLNGVFNTYEFVFLREYKVAAQLALYLNEREAAFALMKMGIRDGWELRSLRKHTYLSRLKKASEWDLMEEQYAGLRTKYLERIDGETRAEVHEMFKKDQRMALGALFRIGDKAQERYAFKKFAPHSEAQVNRLIGILESRGYPGEWLIGNDFWASTILSHHNSITRDYVRQDTLYHYLKPMLEEAIGNGQMSPYEFALIVDWRIAAASDRSAPGYGFLNPPRQADLEQTNELRRKIGLRSVELRNKLVDIENKTGMDFELPDWVQGKIEVE